MKKLVFTDGRELQITGETGKYWLCGEEQYRKLSKTIAGIKEEEQPKETLAEDKPKPKRKPAKKKKVATEDRTDGDCGE